ncbi:MAG TPA: hypothetical protein VF384_04780 [Planctomycetota bacterium]
MHETALEGGLNAPAGRLLAFAAHLRRLHVRRAVLGAALRSLLLVAGPGIVVAWLVPEVRWIVVLALAATTLAGALLAGLRTWGVTDAALLRMTDDALPDQPGVDVLSDELATWLECHRRARADVPMARWLGEDVAAKLPALPRDVIAHVGRSGLGRRRWLLPVVILLLLAWWLCEWLAPPWAGVLGGRATIDVPSAGGSGPGPGSGAGGAPSPGGDAEPQPGDQPVEPPPRPSPPAVPPPSPSPDQKPEPVEPEQPAPLLDLPAQQRFIVPEFVGDGPTRRVRMHAAELERAGQAPQGTSSTSGAGGTLPPPASLEQFERAAEAALRSRHVPAEERPMVRRFFELLRQAAK